jgi:hypothetical protein
VEPLHLAGGRRTPDPGESMSDAVLAADPIEQHLGRAGLAEAAGELTAIVGQHLSRHPIATQRWAKRQLPWKRRADYELSPGERDTVPIMIDTDELLGPVAEFFSLDVEVGLFVVLAVLVLVALGVLALVGVVREWVVPFLIANLGWIGVALAMIAVLVLLDRLTRPWFIEAESARLFHAPGRIWRIHGWWRSRRAFRAVVTAITEGRIDNERGVILFTERSTAP